MANLQGTFFSQSLCRSVHFTAVLCNDNPYSDPQNPHYNRPVKNVYLLHGYSGCDTDWMMFTSLGETANEFNLNFFMPGGENSFYLDHPATGCNYATFTGKEFIDYTRKTFGLSARAEDTMIGGLSMGGFGAIHTGLMFPETFSKIIGLSSALIAGGITGMKPTDRNPVANYEYYHRYFGDLDALPNTENDPAYLAKKLAEAGTKVPGIYMAIGTEDNLIHSNVEFKKVLDELDIPVEFVTAPGIHDFVFWRKYLVEGLKWALNE